MSIEFLSVRIYNYQPLNATFKIKFEKFEKVFIIILSIRIFKQLRTLFFKNYDNK